METKVGTYAAVAYEARTKAAKARRAASAATGFEKTALLDQAKQFEAQAKRFDGYAAQQAAKA